MSLSIAISNFRPQASFCAPLDLSQRSIRLLRRLRDSIATRIPIPKFSIDLRLFCRNIDNTHLGRRNSKILVLYNNFTDHGFYYRILNEYANE